MLSRMARSIALLALISGCGGDEPALPPVGPGPVVRVELDAAGAGFTETLGQIKTPAGLVVGPFLLSGQNIRHDYASNRLLVDLTVSHRGNAAVNNPVRLLALDIESEGVARLDSLAVIFPFANDDTRWTPGEISRPLVVSFAANPGATVAFFAELGAGFEDIRPVDEGEIRGTVWLDDDFDGVRGSLELGAEGVTVEIVADDPEVGALDILAQTVTNASGDYSFADLGVGAHRVRVKSESGLFMTTAAELAVQMQYSTVVTGQDFGVTWQAPGTLGLGVAADTMVRSDSISRFNDNHGADAFLGVGTDEIRTLLQFNLDAVQAPVVSAVLEMTIAHYISGSNQTYRLEIHRVVESGSRTPWIEGNGSEVRPAPPGVVWVNEAYGVAWLGADNGGDANNQGRPDFNPASAGGITLIQASQGAGTVISWDITVLVNGWINGDYPNYGFYVRDVFQPSSFRQVWFGSRDALARGYTDARVQPGPRLILELE